jgi:WD40 repeat protein
LYTVKDDNEIVTSLSSNFSGNYLAVGESSGIIKIFDVKRRKVIDEWQ